MIDPMKIEALQQAGGSVRQTLTDMLEHMDFGSMDREIELVLRARDALGLLDQELQARADEEE